MRWINLTVVVLFCVAVFVFLVQNLESATMNFLGYSVRMPLAILVLVVYLLGMATGGSLLSLLRRSIEGSRSSPAVTP